MNFAFSCAYLISHVNWSNAASNAVERKKNTLAQQPCPISSMTCHQMLWYHRLCVIVFFKYQIHKTLKHSKRISFTPWTCNIYWFCKASILWDREKWKRKERRKTNAWRQVIRIKSIKIEINFSWSLNIVVVVFFSCLLINVNAICFFFSHFFLFMSSCECRHAIRTSMN